MSTAAAPHMPAHGPPPGHQPSVMSGYQQTQQTMVQPTEGRNGHFLYRLHVEQQPDRARMCGFGDKDRRPITPPICVRLVITDTNTGREIDVNEISSEFFVLQVDLFDVTGQTEVNLVRHSTASPSMSISMASVASYPPAPENAYGRYQPPYNMYGGYDMPQPNQYSFNPNGFWQPHPTSLPPVQQGSNNNFTRNLIGSTNVSAAQLADPNGKVGFWFVLQDLSVRQEGTFRLKMSFFDLMSQSEPGKLAGQANVLATVYSDSFQVHSAKRFPGVKESTSLSKCFASQGVKIPIRKDGANKSANGDDDD